MNTLVPGSLLAMSLLLGVGLVYEAVAPVDAIEIDEVKVNPRPVAAFLPPDYTPPPEQDFAAINARSLFVPSRQPVSEPPGGGGGGTAAAPPNVTLIGVILGQPKSVAILKVADSPASVTATVGQTVAGWQVTRIEAGGVVFHANSTDYEVRLHTGPAQSGAVRPRPPPGPSDGL
jgi:hypothetical protein